MNFPKAGIFSFGRIRGDWITYVGADGSVSYNKTYRTVRCAIRSDEFHDYNGKLIEYLKSLLRKCGEVLHVKGQTTFLKSKVVITLPDEQGEETVLYFHEESVFDPEWVFYELMAQVSGMSVYKALAPKEVNGFVRTDHDDDHESVSYKWRHCKQQQGKDILVGVVGVEFDFEPPRHQEAFSFWVSYIKNGGHTRVGFSEQVFNSCMTSTCKGTKFDQHSVGISSFSVAVPYQKTGTDLFPRLAFLEKVTSALREAFPAVHGGALEAA